MAALLSALAILAAAPGDPMPMSRTLLSVALQGGGLGIEYNQVTIISRVSSSATGGAEVWIAERRRNNQRIRKWTVDHQWIDGRRCPALMTALKAIERLPAMRFGSPGKAPDTGLVMDAALTTLRGQTADAAGGVGVMLTRSEYHGPFATWAWQLDRDVEGCWQDERVTVTGAHVMEHLATSLDLKSWGRP